MDQLFSGTNLERKQLTARYLQAAAAHKKDFALLKREAIPAEPDKPAPPNADHPTAEERTSLFGQILLMSAAHHHIAQKLVRAGKVSAAPCSG
jgi:hypothetical protein